MQVLVTDFLLMIGLVIPSMNEAHIRVVDELSYVYFESEADCKETARHQHIIESVKELFPENQIRIWCEPVKRRVK